MITLAIVSVHLVIAVLVARAIFGRVRARILTTANCGSYHDMSPEARVQGAGVILAVTCVVGLWPLLIVTALVMVAPPKTPDELRKQARDSQRRVAELERELGMKP